MNREQRRQAARKSVVTAAMSVASDVSSGSLEPESLEAQAVEECRRLFGHVDGPEDPLWELHVEVARQVLAVGGGIPADELAEWAAVQALADGTLADEVLTVPEADSSASEVTAVESVDVAEGAIDADVTVESAAPQRDPTMAELEELTRQARADRANPGGII